MKKRTLAEIIAGDKEAIMEELERWNQFYIELAEGRLGAGEIGEFEDKSKEDES